MAEELRLALILLGSLAIGAVILHGIWTVRKTIREEQTKHGVDTKKSPVVNAVTEESTSSVPLKQLEMDFNEIFDASPLAQEGESDSASGLPVVDMNVDSIYKSADSDNKSHPDKAESSNQENIDEPSSKLSNDMVEQPSKQTSLLEAAEEEALEVAEEEALEVAEEEKSAEEKNKDKDQQKVQNTTLDKPISTTSEQLVNDNELGDIGRFSAISDDEIDPSEVEASLSSEFADEQLPQNTHSSDKAEQSQNNKKERIIAADDKPQEVLLLYIDKADGEAMSGAKLLPLLLTLGLKFGEMDFFHRYERSSGQGDILFSLVNMYNPGSFDIDNMEQMSTRGLTIFMTLPNAGEPLQTFNMMHNAAKKIADEFGAQVLDAKRRPIDISIIRSYVEKIRKF